MRIRKKIIELIIIIFALFLAYVSSSFILNRQLSANEIRVHNFYRMQQNSLDMVMIGSSSVYTSFSSPLAWKQEGFTSYVLATSGAPMGIMKSMLIEVRKTQNPKLIVVDINGALYNDELETREGSLRFWIDNMPWSQNKIQIIQTLIPKKDRMSYYIPLMKYHNNWTKLVSCLKMSALDFKAEYSRDNLAIRGMSGKKAVYTWKKKEAIDIRNYNKKQSLYPLAKQHLDEFLNYLDDNQITNIVFVNMPRFYSYQKLRERRIINQAIDVIQSHGFDMIDLDKSIEQIGLDRNRDFYDKGHVNIYGQKKVTTYLSKLLAKNYRLANDHLDDTLKRKWNKEYASYQHIYKWVDHEIRNKSKSINYDERSFSNLLEK